MISIRTESHIPNIITFLRPNEFLVILGYKPTEFLEIVGIILIESMF